MTDDVIRLVASLRELRDACADVYQRGLIPAEPFIRAGNVLDDFSSLLTAKELEQVRFINDACVEFWRTERRQKASGE